MLPHHLAFVFPLLAVHCNKSASQTALGRYLLNRVFPVDEYLPELINCPGFGKPPAHPDDRYWFNIDVIFYGKHARAPWLCQPFRLRRALYRFFDLCDAFFPVKFPDAFLMLS